MKRIQIAVYSPVGILKKICSSIKEAADYTGVKPPNIHRAAAKDKNYIKVNGFYVRDVEHLKDEYGKVPRQIILSTKTNSISTYDLKGKRIKIYEDVDSLSEALNISKKDIRHNLIKGTLLSLNETEFVFVQYGSIAKVKVAVCENCRPLRLYKVIKEGQLEFSSFNVAYVAERLGISRKLVHSAAQAHRNVLSGSRKIYFTEAKPLMLVKDSD